MMLPPPAPPAPSHTATPDALAQAYQANPSDSTFRPLLAIMQSQIGYLLRSLPLQSHQLEDSQQAAALGVFKALKTWDASKGSFRKWATYHIKNTVTDETICFASVVRNVGANKSTYYNAKDRWTPDGVVYLDDEDAPQFSSPGDRSPEDAAYHGELRAIARSAAKGDYQRYLVDYVILGDTTLEDAGRKWGVSRQAATLVVEKLKKKIYARLAKETWEYGT